ncbi:MAG: MFS transporter [Chlamydiota bacterium]
MTTRIQQKRQFLVILIVVFLGFIGISMPYLIFPALFLNPDYSILPATFSSSSQVILLGITLGAYPLGQFIGSPILGALSDDYGRKKLLATSLAITGVCNLLTGFAIKWHNLELLIISRFIAGLMEGNIAIARAMASDLKTISKHKSFGNINAAASIAFILGPLLGGLLTDKSLLESLTTSTPFYFICVLFFALSILAAFILKNSVIKTQIKVQTIWQRLNLIKKISLLFTNKRLQFLMICSTCFTLAVDIFYEFGPVYLTIKWGLGPSQLVFYNGILCLALAIGNGWLPTFFSSRISNKKVILYSIGAFSIFLMGIILVNSNTFMMLLFGLCGLAIGLGATFMTVNISNSVSDEIQGEVMGVQISLRVLGDALICIFGGALLLLSPKLILILAAVISIAIMIYYAITTKKIINKPL